MNTDLSSDGYVIVRNVFKPEDVILLRENVERIGKRELEAGLASVTPLGTILAYDVNDYRELRTILNQYDFRSILQEGIGLNVVYTYDSSIQIGSGFSGWHKDIRLCDRSNPSGEDWKDDFLIFRVGIYLQDHERYSGGLLVRRGSHRVSPRKGLLHAASWLPGPLKRVAYKTVMRQSGTPTFVGSAKGDLVIFSLRITHAGHALRIKGLPSFVVEPKLQRFLPTLMNRVNPDKRIAIFLTFAVPNYQLDKYMQYLGTRDYYMVRRTNRMSAGFRDISFSGVNCYQSSQC